MDYGWMEEIKARGGGEGEPPSSFIGTLTRPLSGKKSKDNMVVGPCVSGFSTLVPWLIVTECTELPVRKLTD